MNIKVSVLGGIIGSAIVFPGSLVAVITSSIGSSFARGASMKVAMILSVLTMIGALSTISFTAINFVKPENELKKITSMIVLVTRAIATISVIYMLIQSFSVTFLFVLVAAVAVLLSGLIQTGMYSLPE